MKRISPLIVAFVLQITTDAFAGTWAPTWYRCTFDQITSRDKAMGRQRWAKKWADRDPYNKYVDPNIKDRYFWWDELFSSDAADALNHYNIWLYPVYVDENDSFRPWKGPGAIGTSTETYSGTQIYNLHFTAKPVSMMNDGVCEPGCYTPDQQVLFKEGPTPIQAAQESGRTDLMTLAPEATFEKMNLSNNEVESYTADKNPAIQTILTFRMLSGGRLSVTLEHPLVTHEGTIKKAKDFNKGEYLVKQDGSMDEIVDIDRQEWYGRTFNLRPSTTDLTSNILVAEGYLNGSSRFQSEFTDELNRLFLRRNVPDELIPND